MSLTKPLRWPSCEKGLEEFQASLLLVTDAAIAFCDDVGTMLASCATKFPIIPGSAKLPHNAAVMVKDAPPPETQEEALEFLARRLHWKMEHLDPTDGPEEWEQLSEHQREFYRACVNAVFQERRIARIALGHEGAPTNKGIITPEMLKRGSSVLTELQDAGCFQGYVLEKVYLAMRALEGVSAE
jgi:hypothetical protein